MAGRLPAAWGADADDLLRDHPADSLVEQPAYPMTRAVTVAAPPELTWRWVCQMAVAPYSYDLVDNLGRRSPRELTPGAEGLRVGQSMLIIFDVVSVDPGRQWTGVTRPSLVSRMVGPVSVTYAVQPAAAGTSRLVARMVARERGPGGWLWARALAWGDLVMMRKQLLTLKALAERDARR
ncbi:hypothetical protein [Nocardioides psychrotolerans]|uniref:hypothetical protein n=1 Tax=Nocardioides psychrotolerans TaxID=1005945 RepID=UPI003137DBD4